MAKVLFEQLGGWYVRQGDYELSALSLQPKKEQKVGVWGQTSAGGTQTASRPTRQWSKRHRTWLKGRHRVLYYNLLTSGKLHTHLIDV